MIGFELRDISEKGEGVFATKPFKKGETVMVGEIEKILKQNDSHASQIGDNKYARHAGLISKVNHSCAPNCGISVNSTGGHNFIAIKEIKLGAEITFDYAMRNYGIEHFPPLCQCGAEKCRGTITGWKDLPQEKKTEYQEFAAPYLFKLDNKYSANN